jgi:hypothetical protein
MASVLYNAINQLRNPTIAAEFVTDESRKRLVEWLNKNNYDASSAHCADGIMNWHRSHDPDSYSKGLYEDLFKWTYDRTMPYMRQLARIAVAHNSVVYGGFVRDAVINESYAEDIDIWVRETDEASFLTDLEKNGFVIHRTSLMESESETQLYPFTRAQLGVILPNGYTCGIDIIRSEIFPVNDFDMLIKKSNLKHGSHDHQKIHHSQQPTVPRQRVLRKDQEGQRRKDVPVLHGRKTTFVHLETRGKGIGPLARPLPATISSTPEELKDEINK